MRKKGIIILILVFTLLLSAFSVFFLHLSDSKKNESRKAVCDDPDLTVFSYVKENTHLFFLPSGLDYLLPEAKTDVFQSENIPSVFIQTVQKDMDYINTHKNDKVDMRLTLVDETGKKVLSRRKGTIKGRGNNSWNADKKSYGLKLEEKTDLLDMGAARSWILIPNTADPSSLHNKTVMDLAGQVMEDYVPQCEYVNVYFNGSYNGLYLLSEKVEVDEQRLDLNKKEVLLKRELPMRLELVDNGFETKLGNVIEITYPETVSAARKQEIMKQVQQMEDAICTEEGLEGIDVRSWTLCYLIDELFDNLDAGIASAYFYFREDGLCCRGPLWDYDALLQDVPDAAIADGAYRHPYSRNDYYHALMEKEAFRKSVQVLFESEIKPLCTTWLQQEITQQNNKIKTALRMDALRWDYETDETYAETFCAYLQQKAAFLSDYLKDKGNLCKVQIQEDIFYRTYEIEKGKKIREIPELKDRDLGEYVNADTGETVSGDSVVESDLRLELLRENAIEDVPKQGLIEKIGFLNLAALAGFLFSFLYLFYRVRRRHG